ncbi:hypothetical protein UFOVP154_49 [uncultured Caudovirales phage]|uniref:Uncharacterized protein n=1 Tax=uncultured Caudovirales phage TaxID=2100421 RepID=A0A6J7WC34_9CAUD|nr:hypothetical protein UFOVP8_34 [uncultured Caudovirales phage]CAB5170789.1 hypothetical protein UFOVP154_49 [uncultured Caudovirales phage]
MNTVVALIIAVVIGFIGGMLVGRNNKSLADKAAAASQAALDEVNKR